MTFPDFIFYAVSVLILISASYAVFSIHIKPAITSSAVCMLIITIIFFYLGSDYIAVLHLFIFTGVTCGIILLTAQIKDNHTDKFITSGSVITAIIIAVFTALLAGNLISTKWKEITPKSPGLSAGEITGLIQTEYFLPMMLLAVIIFVGVIGSSYMAKRN